MKPHQTANPEQALLSALKAQLHATLDEVCEHHQRFVYVDYPAHLNVGDLLIYAGTEHWIREKNINIEKRWCLSNFDFPKLAKDVCILCHGGGNFGDLYGHQTLREEIVGKYPDNPIIFLPQTVHFTSAKKQEESIKKLSQHKHLTLLFRDQQSLQSVKTQLPDTNCHLAPDMAHSLHPISTYIKASDRKTLDTLCLIREDIEATPTSDDALSDCHWRGDWDALLGPWHLPGRLVSRTLRMLASVIPANSFATIWRSTANQLIARSAREFTKAHTIRTSRMHGHIFSMLLGLPHQLIDNSYGKNSRYFQQWHADNQLGKLLDQAPTPPIEHKMK